MKNAHFYQLSMKSQDLDIRTSREPSRASSQSFAVYHPLLVIVLNFISALDHSFPTKSAIWSLKLSLQQRFFPVFKQQARRSYSWRLYGPCKKLECEVLVTISASTDTALEPLYMLKYLYVSIVVHCATWAQRIGGCLDLGSCQWHTNLHQHFDDSGSQLFPKTLNVIMVPLILMIEWKQFQVKKSNLKPTPVMTKRGLRIGSRYGSCGERHVQCQCVMGLPWIWSRRWNMELELGL